MNYSFHEAAEKEFFAAIEYYESCQSGLGLRFSEEVYAGINRIIEHPDAWTQIDSKTRRCLINKFPFGILYLVFENNVLIIAIMHLQRKPGYWESRKF